MKLERSGMIWVATDGTQVFTVESDREYAEAFANGYNRIIKPPHLPVTVEARQESAFRVPQLLGAALPCCDQHK